MPSTLSTEEDGPAVPLGIVANSNTPVLERQRSFSEISGGGDSAIDVDSLGSHDKEELDDATIIMDGHLGVHDSSGGEGDVKVHASLSSLRFERNRFSGTYIDADTENTFKVFSFHKTRILIPLGALLCSAVGLYVVLENDRPERRFTIAPAVVAGLFFLIAIASSYHSFRSSSTFQSKLLDVKYYEWGAAALMVTLAINRHNELFFRESCYNARLEEGSGKLYARHVCIDRLDPYSIVAPMAPVYFFDCRFLLGVAVISLFPISFIDSIFLFRGVQGYHLMSADVIGLTFFFLVTLCAGAIAMVWLRDRRARAYFESWVQLRLGTKELFSQCEQVDNILSSLLPSSLLARLKKGAVAFEYAEQATIAVTEIHDYHYFVTTITPLMHATLIDTLFTRFDDTLVNKKGVIKLKTAGDRYIASTKLETAKKYQAQSKLDSCAADGDEFLFEGSLDAAILLKFVSWQVRSAKRISALLSHPFRLKGGVDTGSVCGGIIGHSSLWYDVAGEALGVACTLADSAAGDTVLLSEAACDDCEPAISRLEPRGEVQSRYADRSISVFEVTVKLGKIGPATPNRHSPKCSLPSRRLTSSYMNASGGEPSEGSAPPPTAAVTSSSITSCNNSSSPRSPARSRIASAATSLASLDECSIGPGGSRRVSADTDGRAVRYKFLFDRLGIQQESFFGMDNALAFSNLVKKEFGTSKKKSCCSFRWSYTFKDPELEERYRKTYNEGIGGARSSMPFALGTLCLMLFITCLEHSITPASSALFLFILSSFVIWFCISSRVNFSTMRFALPVEMAIAVVWYVLPLVTTFFLNSSILAYRRQYYVYIFHVFNSDHLTSYGWMPATSITFIINTICMVADFVLINRSMIPLMLFFPYIFYRDRVSDSHRRARFQVNVLSQAFHRAASEELNLQQGLLKLVVPETLVDTFVAKQQHLRMSGTNGKREDFLTALGDVSLLVIRVDDFSTGLHSLLDRPHLAVAQMERVYSDIQRVVAREGVIIEKVMTMGDIIVVAGPLYENDLLEQLAASVAVPQGKKYLTDAAGRVAGLPGGDTSLSAAVALLDVFSTVLRDFATDALSASHSPVENPLLGVYPTPTAATSETSPAVTTGPETSRRISCVFHVDAAFAAIVGRQRPSFSLLGPASRKGEVLMEASPTGSWIMTESFQRLLSNGKIYLPRSPADFSIAPPAQWRVRGAGVTSVYPLYLQPHEDLKK